MFIKLTNIRDEAEYVNISKVETIGSSSIAGSIIYFSGENNYILVKETPEEIIEKIKLV